MILVLFRVWEDARVWVYNHSFDMYLNYLGAIPCFSDNSFWYPEPVMLAVTLKTTWKDLQMT